MYNMDTQISLFDISIDKKDLNAFSDICDILGCDKKKPSWPDDFGRLLNKSLNGDVPITTLSLFSGAGGLDIGFEDAGFNIVECVEIEKKFCDTLKANSATRKSFSHKNINCIDIREYTSEKLPPIDFVIGGPPCQTFSAAGRRANGVLGISDERGVLFREYVRLLDEIKPKGFLFENVYGITGAQNGSVWQEILHGFSSIGYKLFYRILDAADYGVPQHRERLIIIGLKEGTYKFPRPTHGPDSIDESEYYTAKQAVDSVVLIDDEKIEGINGRYGHLLDEIPPGLNYSFFTEEMGHPNPIFAWRSKFSDFLYKADPDSPVRTIKAQGGQYTGPFHWNNRNFSVSEYKRLQTFPDTYLIVGNKQTQLQQIGNSVPPQLARILAMSIRDQIFNGAFEFKMSYLNEYDNLGFRKRKRLLTEKYRETAKKALKGRKCNTNELESKSYNYNVLLTDNFNFCEVEATKSDFSVFAKWNDSLRIILCDSNLQNPPVDKIPLFSIEIIPNHKNWGLDVGKIKVECFSNKHLSYTAAWKAVENELIKKNLKADLVQLCGYYQYTPKINCKLICNDSDSLVFLKDVVNGSITRKMISNNSLADIWNISTDQVTDFALKMRCLGYEIRNSMTNPQIESDQWLIPYAFPTLSPKSVQLRKSLVRC